MLLPLLICILSVAYIVANMLPNTLINRLRGVHAGPQLPSQAPRQSRRVAPSTQVDLPNDDDSFKPTPIDITVARILLMRALRCPPDIVDTIFDYAEYWAHSSNEIDYILEHKAALRVLGRSKKEDHFLVRSFPIGLVGLNDREDLADVLQYDMNETKPRPLRREHPPSFFSKLANYPTPRLAHPVRKIVFTTTSRDQGGAISPPGYQDGWTWFEAGLERFDADQTCEAECVSDLRYKSKSSVAPALPMCALRPMYPVFSKRPKPMDGPSDQTSPPADNASGDQSPAQEYGYDHGHLPVDERLIQRNQTRNREMKTHVVQWSWTDDIDPESDDGKELQRRGRGRGTGDGQFVRSLKMGDVVTVWGKAKFPAWANNIEKVQIDVYWAV